MKNITLCSFLLLCLGSMPLWALKGKDDDTPENPKPMAAAANPSTSQTTTPAVAKAAPREVVMIPPKTFILDIQALTTLRSTAPKHAKKKEALLEDAARTVKLQIGRTKCHPMFTDHVPQLMEPFKNVRSLCIDNIIVKDLPLLPCAEKLESLVITFSGLEAIRNITRYTNLRTFQIRGTSLGIINQNSNQTDRLAMLTQLHKLRQLNCSHFLTLDDRAPEDSALLIRILDNNPEIEDFTCAGGVATDVVQALATLPLRRLLLMSGEIDDDKFALLPFGTLEELRLHGTHTLTDLTPLQGSHLRVFHLHGQENLGDTQVIGSMPNLEELDLNCCHLTDAQAEPLLQLAQRLRHLNLDSSHPRLPRLSPEMCQSLKTAFGDKVSLKIWP
ncbi:MAG: hypothetical protein ACPGUZ_00325 [Holosporaceae bacterium]